MNAREIVVCIYVLSFFLALLVLQDTWQYLDAWHQSLTIFQLFVAFSAVLIAYWVYADGGEISQVEKQFREQMDYFRKKFEKELEKLHAEKSEKDASH